MKNQTTTTSQDFDRKAGRDHAANNPRVNKSDLSKSEMSSYPKQDKRALAREEHTNHFTNRSTD